MDLDAPASSPGERPRHLILANPQSGSAQGSRDALESWAEERGHTLVWTASLEQATTMARAAAATGQGVVAAGGDGSFQAVAQAALRSTDAPPLVGLIPLGTGNDLARSLGFTLELEHSLGAIDAGHELAMDVLEVLEPKGASPWCFNLASGGLSGQLAEALDPETKGRLGPLAYLWGGLLQRDSISPFAVELEVDGERWREERLLNVMVANGKFAAGGRRLAPPAELDDGLADVVLIPFEEQILDNLELGTAWLFGETTEARGVVHLQGKSISVRPDPPFAISLDGEAAGEGVLKLEVRPAALRVLAPPRVVRGEPETPAA